MVGASPLLRFLDKAAGVIARLWPGLFAYQILVEATRIDDVETLLDRTIADRET